MSGAAQSLKPKRSRGKVAARVERFLEADVAQVEIDRASFVLEQADFATKQALAPDQVVDENETVGADEVRPLNPGFFTLERLRANKLTKKATPVERKK